MVSEAFLIKKALNNNVVIAEHPAYEEVVLIGKGIGFKKKAGDRIDPQPVEKLFILVDKKEQEQYKQLISQVDERLVELMNDVIHHIAERFATPLNEHIHVALTDHIGFAIKRLEQGLEFKNPFLIETQALYEKEYQVAEEIVDMIRDRLGVQLPESEIGFIAMHIHSAITRRGLAEIKQHSQLILKLIQIVESSLHIKIDRKSISYLRLITHLRYAIERTVRGEEVSEPKGFADLLKSQYPVCYNLAWKLAKVMERTLESPVSKAEISYLTLHLQRLIN
ncbi:glucose PTS transporter transcription antiterminator GlcT [Lihuaxuella thermophila]|uniref:Transcriptional antiterminator/beta-glucoside operon transcriptional antiterminator n=1 Tax=Lihuaxuella thermophila TaxID=1173111 RepID=A0A1H8EZL4_9BACL|nr:transcriptional antiterminator/beta-glucoside operon transcriptional antiterminator [Lihuaxuella thermophila]